MPYKLYLDELRTPRTEGWVLVRSFEEFVATIEQRGAPTEISFDHDLGWDEARNCERPSGYDCAK
ncbi:cyclic-phosphate processing receiver domain-containing protein [Hymenobacter edaphi]|uniref:cyclic-phosphate processing receiver domain-containing protein n=1 Tax=Hymenobacter edaphi TaxID=2211146 RepID=UPI001A9E8C73|nr:cyclic-phosphate processing receiver domain-containing protein [Hymenobacter edaphi]